MQDERIDLFQNVIGAVLNTPGDTTPTLRAALAQQPRLLYGLAAQQGTKLPTELKAYVAKVATSAYKVTDRDVERLRADGYSEDAIFEITLSVAAGAGLLCLQQSLSALKGAKDAPEEH